MRYFWEILAMATIAGLTALVMFAAAGVFGDGERLTSKTGREIVITQDSLDAWTGGGYWLRKKERGR